MRKKLDDEQVEFYLRDVRLLEGRRKILKRELKSLTRGPGELHAPTLDGIGSPPSKQTDAMKICLRVQEILYELKSIDQERKELDDIFRYVDTGRDDLLCSSILIFYYVDGMKIEDIGRKLNLHKATIVRLKNEAVDKMNRMLMSS